DGYPAIRQVFAAGPDARRLAVLARSLPLGLKLPFEALEVDTVTLLGRHQLREIDREAEGVIEPENLGTRDDSTLARGQNLVEPTHALVDRGEEPLLLLPGDPQDVLAAPDKLRMNGSHPIDDRVHDVYECGFAAT